MSLIVAARFQTFDQATVAVQKLFTEGFTEDDVHTFYINTAGGHARYPLGGDRVADPDAKGGHLGAPKIDTVTAYGTATPVARILVGNSSAFTTALIDV